MGLLDSVKSKAKDIAVQLSINYLIGDIGAISDLAINRKDKRITGKLTLTGEEKPVDITIEGWEYGDSSCPNRIRVLGLATSRPWLNAIATKALINRWFDIPAAHMGKLQSALE